MMCAALNSVAAVGTSLIHPCGKIKLSRIDNCSSLISLDCSSASVASVLMKLRLFNRVGMVYTEVISI